MESDHQDFVDQPDYFFPLPPHFRLPTVRRESPSVIVIQFKRTAHAIAFLGLSLAVFVVMAYAIYLNSPLDLVLIFGGMAALILLPVFYAARWRERFTLDLNQETVEWARRRLLGSKTLASCTDDCSLAIGKVSMCDQSASDDLEFAPFLVFDEFKVAVLVGEPGDRNSAESTLHDLPQEVNSLRRIDKVPSDLIVLTPR